MKMRGVKHRKGKFEDMQQKLALFFFFLKAILILFQKEKNVFILQSTAEFFRTLVVCYSKSIYPKKHALLK